MAVLQQYSPPDIRGVPAFPGGGGGGGGGWGSLRYLGVCIRSLSKFKNTPKALIPGQKSTLIFKKNADFFH